VNSERNSTNTKVKQRRLPKKKEIYELKKMTQNMKEELNKVMENLRKKNQTETLEIKSPFSQKKNIVEGHSSRIEQVEDRLSELKDKIEMKHGTGTKTHMKTSGTE
jgi:hypothetical protein